MWRKAYKNTSNSQKYPERQNFNKTNGDNWKTEVFITIKTTTDRGYKK